MVSEIEKADLAALLDRIQRLTDLLVRAQTDSREARELAAGIKREVEATRASIRTVNTPVPSSRQT